MSIVRLKKVTIAGLEKEKRVIVRELQQFGQLHIIESETDSTAVKATSLDQQAIQAIRFLDQTAQKRRTISNSKRFRMDEVVTQTLELKEALRNCKDQLEETEDRIRRMQPWGDFEFPPENALQDLRFWFYILPLNKKKALEDLKLPWQVVGHTERALYVILVDCEEPAADILPVEREHLGSRSLQQLLDAQEKLEIEYEELVAKRQYMTRFLYLMRKHQIRADNHASFEFALAQTENHHEQIFTLQAWMPVDQVKALEPLASTMGFAYQADEPKANEYPPTLLKPKKGFNPGALLANVYQLPAYRSWDPSAHLYLSFVLFFSMILSDAGYALVLLGGLGLGWKKLQRSETGRDMAQLMRLMFSGSLVWGILAGSYFGYAPDNPLLESLNIVDLNNYDAMMQLSVLIGISHIVLANLTLAWGHISGTTPGTAGEWRFVLSRLGWIITVCHGAVWWLAETQWVKEVLAPAGIGTGLLMVFLFSSEQKITNKKQALLFILDGFQSLTSISKLFGDVLSYMRLFALGLASASLALTFNGLAADAVAQGHGAGVLAGAMIFLLGHSINIMLGIMSGVVHGLRLNFIEFYNWGEPGEGYAFDRFAIKEINNE